MYILILQSIPIPFLCIFPLFHHRNSTFYTHYMSCHLWWGGWHDLSTLICIKNMESFFFKWWIWTFFFRYCHLSTVTTETQNTIPIWKTVRVLMNISTVDRLLCMTWSFILLINNLDILHRYNHLFFSPDWIFLNVIFWKLITKFLYIFISVHLIHNASYMQILKNHNHTPPCDDYSLFTWGGILFLNFVSPIITSPEYNIVPEKPPSNDGFINSFWSYLIGIWISNFCVFITLPFVFYLILTW